MSSVSKRCFPAALILFLCLIANGAQAETIVHSLESSAPGTLPVRTAKFPGSSLVDKLGKPVNATCVQAVGRDLYLLTADCLWRIDDGIRLLNSGAPLICVPLIPDNGKIKNVPLQEFNSLVYFAERKVLVILEKSGDLVEFSPATGMWHFAWPNKPMTGAPDPDFIDLVAAPAGIILLDPERNQLWRFDGRVLSRTITPEVLPWRVRRGNPNVSDGIALCQDRNVFILKRSAGIAEYDSKSPKMITRFYSLRAVKDLRPTRISSGPQVLLIADRENNRILKLDKHSGAISTINFPADSDLRGILPGMEGLVVINGDKLSYAPFSCAVPLPGVIMPRAVDYRLNDLRLPIYKSRLPWHPGVWPGARRLYRFGVHKGMDFFYETGNGITIKMGTPVQAAADGRVIRADKNFRDMTASQFNKIMRECNLAHNTSARNEDLFRGCQVWIDHGRGLITKYAHLDHVNSKIKEGDWVKRGSEIGYIGVSGTGENLPGHVKQPHLHFEIWLDGRYLGYGLTPAETIAMYEKIFASK